MTVGRLPVEERGVPLILDNPSKVVEAALTKQDEIIEMLKALTAKLDADTGVTSTNFAETLTDALRAIELKL